MSALQKLPRIAGVAGVGASITALATQPSFLGYLSRTLGLQVPGGAWKVAAIMLALLNLKNLPFMWHIRLFRALIYHIYFQPTPIHPTALFQPIITSTRTPLVECDYNLHKSNSTYFSDIDISRTHLVTALLRTGIKKASHASHKKHHHGPEVPGEAVHEGSHLVALGAVACCFKREIAPYEKFEIWTRLLTWDRKWMYLVSHLVKPGVVKPAHYTLQPWKRSKGRRDVSAEEEEKRKVQLKSAVFASSIAKYVVKKGRLTIHPEQVLMQAEMLPPKPDGWVYSADKSVPVNGESVEDAVLPAVIANSEEWDWNKIEKERLRGLRIAEMFAGLDGLHEEFDGGKNGALGEFADLLW
ncbi:hypothetical protein K432DRAFT_344855 [Lepidopterella palustris CBS 459.81]|uniref:Capsule polysaccharide biosynthesis protein n=1 Tax=Lepidopterella palustris CBS 459.81 TaxID=1314670 RepID=A0A8E2JJ86_9PEZI|nr:hypothetical protein K432DRAFT_344855 [Lepidopterella palustris CBS 459.81]